jgi:hypothetical protein
MAYTIIVAKAYHIILLPPAVLRTVSPDPSADRLQRVLGNAHVGSDYWQLVLHQAASPLSAVIPANVHGSVDPGQGERIRFRLDRIALCARQLMPWLDR